VFDDSGIAFPQPMQGDRGAFTPENFLGDYKMKTMKLALLATAALVAVSASARADSSADLKAQFENLNVYAVADAPAAGSINWSMEVRAAMDYYAGYETYSGSDVDGRLDINARARLKAKASTETSVGAVGVVIRIQGASEFGGGATTRMNEAYGTWAMTDSATLTAGYTGTLSGIGYGAGEATYGGANGTGDLAGDQEQFRLSFASGPMSFAVAVEDGNNFGGQSSDAQFAAEVKYSGDSFSGEVSVGYAPGSTTDVWVAGAGVGFALGDMASLSMAAQTFSNDNWNASVLATVNVSDAAYIEASLGHVANTNNDNFGSTVVEAGAYWAPVDQLTIGVQADYTMFNDDSDSRTSASFVTWFKF
jgi:hypothetical protein